MASHTIQGGSEVVRFDSLRDPVMDPINDFMKAPTHSGEMVVADEKTAKEVDLFFQGMMSNLADVFEERQQRGEAIVALKNKQVEVEGLHQKELRASQAETEAAKQEIETIKETISETVRNTDEHVQAVIAEQTAAVQTAIQSGAVKFAALKQEADALKREVERLRAEKERQKVLARAEKRAAVEAITRQCEATEQAITQQCKAEIEALKQKFQREEDESNLKNRAAIAAAVNAIIREDQIIPIWGGNRIF